MSRFGLVCLIFFSSIQLSGQLSPKTNLIFKQLTSWDFAGRGYVDSGCYKADTFLANQLKKRNLKAFNSNNNYYQSLNIDVNTFPSEIELIIDNKPLITGIDYILDANSPSLEIKNSEFVYLTKKQINDSNFFQNNYSSIKGKKVVICNDVLSLVEESQVRSLSPICLIITKEKLTWTVGKRENQFPIIEVLQNKLPTEIKKINSIVIENRFIYKYPIQNLIGYIEGTKQPDSFIVFTAHYDHLGKLGRNTYFPGANDNASGTVMLLDLIDEYIAKKPSYSIAFMFFAGEEAGLVGSKYYTENPLFPLNKIKFLINLDLVSSGADGAMVVNGSLYKDRFNQFTELNNSKGYLKEIKERGEAKNSDHYYFSKLGVPSFFIYLMQSYPYYHDVFDGYGHPKFKEYPALKSLLMDFVSTITPK